MSQFQLHPVVILILVVIIVWQRVEIFLLQRKLPKPKAYVFGLRKVQGKNLYGIQVPSKNGFVGEGNKIVPNMADAKPFLSKRLAFKYLEEHGYTSNYA